MFILRPTMVSSTKKIKVFQAILLKTRIKLILLSLKNIQILGINHLSILHRSNNMKVKNRARSSILKVKLSMILKDSRNLYNLLGNYARIFKVIIKSFWGRIKISRKIFEKKLLIFERILKITDFFFALISCIVLI